jgi:hypothetical protein
MAVNILAKYIFDISIHMAYLTKMITKIIHFPHGHFERKKQPPLTSLMVVTLLAACAKQTAGIHFGPGDIKGSFTSLITRGLIIRKEVTKNYITESLWQVTGEAIAILNGTGRKVSC